MQVLRDWLIQNGWSHLIATAAAIVAAIVFAYAVGWALRAIAKVPLFEKLKKSQAWQDAISRRKVLVRISRIVVITLVTMLVPPLLADWPIIQNLTFEVLDVLLILLFALAAGSLTSALVDVLSQRDSSEQRLPFKALGQAVHISIWTYASVAILSVITNTDVASVLTGLTAVGAVLVYIFRDPILGWSAGLRMATNDLLRVGDWINVPNHNANGSVIEIALTTVKVRNWDKSISSIPSYSLVSEGFQNWRGMFDSKIRRIKRSIPIDAVSVRFCDPDLIERLGRDPLMKEVLQRADDAADLTEGEDTSVAPSDANVDSISAMRPTNLGYYRAWLEAWVKTHPKIEKSALNMVRELEPEGRGIPVEIYVFTSDQRWEYLEKLQAEIIDHAVAVLPAFDLRLFQEPTGEDLRDARDLDRQS